MKLFSAFLLIVGVSYAQNARPPARRDFTVIETTIPEMRSALQQRRITSRQLVTRHLMRIAIYEHKLNAAITVNPRVLEEADARDRERARGTIRGRCMAFPSR
jgi:amidase